MSFWIYQKEQNGRYDILLVEFPILAGIVILGLLAAIMIPRYLNQPYKIYADSAVLIVLGFILVLLVKLHLIFKGILVSWGSSLMAKPYRIAYRTGYTLLIISAMTIIIALLANR
jgi:hypothetical protein